MESGGWPGLRSVLWREAWVPAAAALAGAWVALGLTFSRVLLPLRYDGDAMFYLVETRLVGEGGYLGTSHLGWPAGMQLYDYPQGGDNLHLFVLRLLMAVTHRPALAVNLYFLIGFALAAVSAHVVLRYLGVGRVLATALAVAYALLPYHFSRGTLHFFLAQYYVVPVGVGLAMYLVRHGRDSASRPVLRRWSVVLAAAVIASTGAYYFAFSVLLFVAAGCAAAAIAGRVRAVVPALALSALSTAVFFVNHVPTLVYWMAHGSNDAALPERTARDAERCGLRVAQLFLPNNHHHIAALARFGRHTMVGWARDESGQQIGVLAATGVLLAVATFVVSALRSGSGSGSVGRHDDARVPDDRLRTLGYLALVAMLTGTVGGVSYLFALGGLRFIRCWNRISVVIAFIGFAALGLVVQRYLERGRHRKSSAGRGHFAVALALLAIVAIDQTPAHFPTYRRIAADVASDRAFYADVAHASPAQGRIFELPHLKFPEGFGPNGTSTYDPAKGYLYQPKLYWSFGAVRGRDDHGIATLADTPPTELAAALTAAGYTGVVLDTKALGEKNDAIEAALSRRVAPLRSADGRYRFFSLNGDAATTLGPRALRAVAGDAPSQASTTSCDANLS